MGLAEKVCGRLLLLSNLWGRVSGSSWLAGWPADHLPAKLSACSLRCPFDHQLLYHTHLSSQVATYLLASLFISPRLVTPSQLFYAKYDLKNENLMAIDD